MTERMKWQDFEQQYINDDGHIGPRTPAYKILVGGKETDVWSVYGNLGVFLDGEFHDINALEMEDVAPIRLKDSVDIEFISFGIDMTFTGLGMGRGNKVYRFPITMTVMHSFGHNEASPEIERLMSYNHQKYVGLNDDPFGIEMVMDKRQRERHDGDWIDVFEADVFRVTDIFKIKRKDHWLNITFPLAWPDIEPVFMRRDWPESGMLHFRLPKYVGSEV